MNKFQEAPFLSVENDDTLDGFTPSMVSPNMAKNWERCNHAQTYSFKGRLRHGWKQVKLASKRFDDWCDQSILHYMVVFALALISLGVVLAVIT